MPFVDLLIAPFYIQGRNGLFCQSDSPYALPLFPHAVLDIHTTNYSIYTLSLIDMMVYSVLRTNNDKINEIGPVYRIDRDHLMNNRH